MLCKYKDIFGKPGEGFHKERVFGLALYDIIGMLILSIAISYAFNFHILKTFLLLTLFVIFIHKLFCVDTAFNKMIF